MTRLLNRFDLPYTQDVVRGRGIGMPAITITDTARQLLAVMVGASGLAFVLLLGGLWLGQIIRVDRWGF